MRIARVEPLTTARAVRGPFDYRLASEQAHVTVGSLVRVSFAGRRLMGVVTGLADSTEVAEGKLAGVEAIAGEGIPPALVELALWMAAEYVSTPARALGLMLPPGALRGHREKRVLVARLTSRGRSARDDGTRLTGGQRAALEALLDGEAEASGIGTSLLRRLERRGLVALEERTRRRRPAGISSGRLVPGEPALTPDQQAVVTEVLAALRPGGPPPSRELLLHGVTGSGKTEVYLRAVREALGAGRGAIILVPEIALTPQTLARFTARFGDTVAVLHSGLSAGERHDEWLRLRRGEARVAVGPRSAVFAPVGDLGLIVVDEEHDGSYKHEGDPRYDARTVARRRAEREQAVLLAGSATPRAESVAWFRRLRLPRRVDERPLPPVRVLDMRGARHPLHPDTRHALGDLRRAGGKGIVLLNRRGWSNFLSCRSCGHVWMCPNCEVALVLHRGGGFVACHHCGHRERVPDRCPSCGSVSLARHGAGTERLEQELRAALGAGDFPVFRLDADVSGRREAAAQVLAGFSAAPAGILVGTQMVAKGHDFPDVGLGVILDADSTLRFPDFRAEERTFAMITQLAGRAGRGSDGRVLVQTLAPDSRAVRRAALHDADGFVEEELRRREALGYPPSGTLVRVICSAERSADADALASRLSGAILRGGGLRLEPPRASLLGPAPLFRLRGRSRAQLVLKTPERARAIAAVGAAVAGAAAVASRSAVSISVDVDPQ